jgi:hypothetical protein
MSTYELARQFGTDRHTITRHLSAPTNALWRSASTTLHDSTVKFTASGGLSQLGPVCRRPRAARLRHLTRLRTRARNCQSGSRRPRSHSAGPSATTRHGPLPFVRRNKVAVPVTRS